MVIKTPVNHNDTIILKLEKGIEYSAYGAILFFYIGRVFEPFVLLIDILFFILLYYKKDKLFLRDNQKIFVGFGLLFLYFVIQSFFVKYPLISLQHSVGMIRFVVFAFALYYVFNSTDRIKRLIYAVFFALSLLMADSIYQYITGVDIVGYPTETIKGRLTAWSDTPKVGESLGVFVGVVMASFFVLKHKLFPALLLLLLFIVMLISGNRGPIVYILGAMFIVTLLSRYRIYLLSVMGLVLITASAVFVINPKVMNEFSVFQNPFDSKNNSGRTTIYKAGIAIIEDSPLIGIGSKNFRYVFRKYYTKVYDPKRDTGFWDKIYATIVPLHVHSMFLSFLINWGVIGSMIFVYILYRLYQRYILYNELALLASISFVYTIFPLNFGKSIAQSQWQFFIFLTLAFTLIMSHYAAKEKQQ